MTLQNHMFKGSCDFMERRVSLLVTTLSSLVAVNILVVVIMYLIFHVILQEHLIIRSYDFMNKSCSRKVTILPSFMAKGVVEIE